MTSIFDYTNYRTYLRNYFEEKKRSNYHFSYQLLAQKAGFSNRGFLYNIMHGKKHLSKSHCYKLSQALGHNKKEAEYFESIVAYTQARDEEERAFFYKQSLKIAGGSATGTKLIRKDQFEFLSKWYHSAIRSLVDMYPISDNYDQVCRKLAAKVTPAQVKKSLQLLERLELIAAGDDGIYHLTGKTIRTSSEITQAARSQFHIECTDLAKRSIRNDHSESRNTTSITMGISKSTYVKIVKATSTFIETLIDLVKQDENPDHVYQYELLLFPLTIVDSTPSRGDLA